jgi:hypothetical protein
MQKPHLSSVIPRSSPTIAKSPAHVDTSRTVRTLLARDMTIKSLRDHLGSPAKAAGDMTHYRNMASETLFRLIKARDLAISSLRRRLEEQNKQSQDLITPSDEAYAGGAEVVTDDEFDHEFEDISPFL